MSVSLAKYGAVFCTVLPPFRLPEAEGCVCSLGQQVPDEEGNDGTLADHPTPEPGWVRMGEPVGGGEGTSLCPLRTPWHLAPCTSARPHHYMKHETEK